MRRWATYRDNQAQKVDLINSGDLLLDPDSRHVVVSGNEIHLTPTEYDLLYYLAKNDGKVIAHREWLQSVWEPE